MPTLISTRCSSRSGIRSRTIGPRYGAIDSADGLMWVSVSKTLKPSRIAPPSGSRPVIIERFSAFFQQATCTMLPMPGHHPSTIPLTSKVKTMAEAAALVRDGDHVALGGFACTRNAVAFTHEIIRQGRRDLTLSAAVLGMDADLLVGAGRVKRLIYGGGSLDRFGTIQCVNRAYEQKTLVPEYYSSLAVCMRYMAGALGIPF